MAIVLRSRSQFIVEKTCSVTHSKVLEIRYLCHIPKTYYCNNNDSELYWHDYNNTALQKRGKHNNYSHLVIRVQFQH